LKNIMI